MRHGSHVSKAKWAKKRNTFRLFDRRDAQHQASRLLSRDRGFYRKLFPKLELLDPGSRYRYS
jgi:hypothetical protein